MDTESYRSFVVRLWYEQDGEWHGEVEHIQSGNRLSFAALAHLLAFFQLAVAVPHMRVIVSEEL